MKLGRKITGGKYHKFRKRKFYENRNKDRPVILGENKKKITRVKGGNQKIVLTKSNIANVLTKSGKIEKAKIVNVIETPQNRFMARQNRLMKGAIIETSLGKAKITNRPGQESHINATLIS